MKTRNLSLTAVFGLSAFLALAQDQGGQPPGAGGPPGPGAPGAGPRRGSPVVAALDANSDGEIDAAEIANASAALKKLDKNNDGKLSGDEIRPQRPGGPSAPGAPGAPAPRAPGQ
jgi:hypothetical protein